MPRKKIMRKSMTLKKRSVKKEKREKKVDSFETFKKEKNKKNIQLLRGMKDILPVDQDYWRYLRNKATDLASFYGFSAIDTPILEMTNLFRRAVGDSTDIVEKEMYTFTDPGGELISLRPEITASVCRAYIEHGMTNQPQPVKMFYFGPCFRHDRPQTGRYRQFYQFGLESIGEINPAVDAEVILLSFLFVKEVGIESEIQINSIGCPNCRAEYKKNLVAYYRRKKRSLCHDCQKRLVKNPLRLLDCKEPECQESKEEAPQIIDWLCEECKNHFMKVLEYLDALGIPYSLNPYLVRGLDYYTKTVYEIIPVVKDNDEERRQSSLAGGGRYDGLIELLSGKPVPACGFSVGIERMIIEMRKQGIEPPLKKPIFVFLAQIGEQAKQKSFKLFEDFRKEKMPVAQMFAKDSLKSQLELADKLGAKYVVILGQKEVLEGTVLLRDMEGGVQENIDFDKIISEIKKKIKEGKVK
jgi:histidyl-tRNA synthetase